MHLALLKLPVFLPGNNRNWTQVDGVARITDRGVLTVELSEENAKRLVNLAEKGILLQVSFDYKMPVETIDKINAQNRKEN